jgi:hypothetical protein
MAILTTPRNGLGYIGDDVLSDHWLDYRNAYAASFQKIDAAIALCNFEASSDPSASDDNLDGWAVGSWWWNRTGNRLFNCKDASTGTAVWVQVWPGDLTLMADGSRALNADWNAGAHKITAQQLESSQVTGLPPLIVASTTKVADLNSDKLDDADLSTDPAANPGVDTKVLTEQALRETLDQGFLLTMVKNETIAANRVVSFVLPAGQAKTLADSSYSTTVNGFLVIA